MDKKEAINHYANKSKGELIKLCRGRGIPFSGNPSHYMFTMALVDWEVDNMAKALVHKPYLRVIVADEQSGKYAARVHEFPGCFAEGDTASEAAANLEASMVTWALAALNSGQAIPPPRGDVEFLAKRKES